MKKIKSLLVLTLFTTVILTSCATTDEEPVKGVESSVNETGDVKAVKITANNCNVTQGCDPTSKVLQTANKNANLNVINKVNEDWYCVKLANNQIGFVPQQQCTPVLPDNAINKGNAGQTPVANKAPTPGTPGTAGNAGNADKNKMPGNNIEPPRTGALGKRQVPNKDNNGTTGDNTVANDNAENENTTTNKNISNEEQQLINLINESRKQNGLKALAADNQISEIARIKSKDMIDNNYFSHNSPTYGDPFKMLQSFGIQYLSAAENIAGNKSVQEAHEALMNSPGHRKNLLNPEFTHVGVGIQKGSQYGYMFTELFIKK